MIRALISKARSRASDAGIKRGDLVLVALLLALSVLLLYVGRSGGDAADSVRVCVNGEQVALLPLDTDTVYKVPGGCGNVLEISDGRACMLSADCPDESCVRQGYISRAGECLVCLPGRVTATVVANGGETELDAVAY